MRRIRARCRSRSARPSLKPRFFRSAAGFRKWLALKHAAERELLVGFWKTSSGRPSMTWPEAVDEALCFGWIDGIRRRVDDSSYTIRFTPRRRRSIWSSVNIGRVQALAAQGRMAPAGLREFSARRENQSGIYSYERRPEHLDEPYSGVLAKNGRANKFFANQAASYRRAAIWWVLSAKREPTRLRRVRSLVELSNRGELIPQFRWQRSPAKARGSGATSAASSSRSTRKKSPASR